jgi:hypothetical protein
MIINRENDSLFRYIIMSKKYKQNGVFFQEAINLTTTPGSPHMGQAFAYYTVVIYAIATIVGLIGPM